MVLPHPGGEQRKLCFFDVQTSPRFSLPMCPETVDTSDCFEACESSNCRDVPCILFGHSREPLKPGPRPPKQPKRASKQVPNNPKQLQEPKKALSIP